MDTATATKDWDPVPGDFTVILVGRLISLIRKHYGKDCGMKELSKHLLPVGQQTRQTSTLEDKVVALCDAVLPDVLKQLKVPSNAIGAALCRLAVRFQSETEPREAIYDCFFKFVQEERRKVDQLTWPKPYIKPLFVAVVHVACQTDPENTSAREESDEQLVVKVTALLKTPHTPGAFIRELQTANLPEGTTLRQLVTNAMSPPAAGATAGNEALTDSDGSSESSDGVLDSDSESETDSDESDAVEDNKKRDADGDSKYKAVQEETRRNEERRRMQPDAAPAERDAMSGHGTTSSKCKNCRTREAALVLLPCGHFCVCYRCISAISRCPVCAGEIQTTVRAYRR